MAVLDPFEPPPATIEARIAFAFKVYRGYVKGLPPHADRDEMLGVALEAFIKHDRKYDPSFGVPWTAYMAMHIRWDMIEAVRASFRVPDPIEIRSIERGDKGGDRLPGGRMAFAEPSIDDETDRVALEYDVAQAMSVLRKRDHLVIYLRFFEGLAEREIGEMIGVSESRVSQILFRAKAEMRAFLTGLEEEGATFPEVHKRLRPVPIRVPQPAAQGFRPLSKAEKDVLVKLTTGMNAPTIALSREVATSTVTEQLRSVRKKLIAKNTTHAVAQALRHSLIPYPPRDDLGI